MKNILDNLLLDIQTTDVEEQISTLILIASLTQDILEPLALENASKICSVIYKSLYGNNLNKFQYVVDSEAFMLESWMIRIYNKPLWQAIWFNSLNNSELLFSKNILLCTSNHSHFLLWCIDFILKNINTLNKNSLYLLRCLQKILNRIDYPTCSLGMSILQCMSNVALSPHTGFKQLAHNISKTILPSLEKTELLKIYNLHMLPVRGIDIREIVELLPDYFVKENLEIIVIKVVMMFSNNIEKKDGGILYEKILTCTFEEWVKYVWPHFFDRLQEVEYEGELFQSLIKYWIPLTINAYRTDFYDFAKLEKIDQKLKSHILYEARRKGFHYEDNIFVHLDLLDVGLKIISTYKKKSHCPGTEDIHFFMTYLFSNLRSYLEDEEIDSVKKFFSQIIYVAHADLRKIDKNFKFYQEFLDQIYYYCYRSLNTDFFEVGAQILDICLNILKGSHKELNLLYKLDKKDFYESGENRLFIKLNEKHLWKFENEIYFQIWNCCLRIDGYSLILTNLIIAHYCHYSSMDADVLKSILKKVEHTPNIKNTEKIINCSNIFFSQKNRTDSLSFIEEIQNKLLAQLNTNEPNETALFKKVLYLEILTIARKHQFEVWNLNNIVSKCFKLLECILQSEFLMGLNYRCTKVVETFITRVIFLISQNLQEVWMQLDKHYAINIFIKVIEKSNMKKPVSLSADLLRQFVYKLEQDDIGMKLKINLLNKTVDDLQETYSKKHLRIRRNPETRLVLHAICISQKNSNKPFLHWTMDHLIKLISNPNTPDLSISSSLHTIELLIGDNRLHEQTLCYIPEIVTECVQLFRRPNWIVRNADLQLVKALIERLYGVSMNNSYRPRSIIDLLIVYPSIASYFFKIISLEELDDRAVIIFQFFSESYVKKSAFNMDFVEIMEYFQILLMDIIKNYQNHYGKLAVKSLASICYIENIPSIFSDIVSFIIKKFVSMPKNIFANMLYLMQELYEKYKNSYENYTDSNGLRHMHLSWINMSNFLKQFDTKLFDYLGFKFKSIEYILNEKLLEDNIWVQNNLTFFFSNANADLICGLLAEKLFLKVSECFQIKMLTIMIERFQNGEFSYTDLEKITNVLFQLALASDEDSSYIQNCYLKCLILFQENVNITVDIKVFFSRNIYKNLILLLYASKKSDLNLSEQFFTVLINDFKSSLSTNEDLDYDILSTLTISYSVFPTKFHLDIFKIVFYFSLFRSTHLQAYYFIAQLTNKSYSNVLDALNIFCSAVNLRKFLENETHVRRFLMDVNNFLDSNFNEGKCDDEFYVVEDEMLVPISFVKKLLWCKKCLKKR